MRNKRVAVFPLSAGQAEALIRKISQDTGKVILSGHALVRMEERGISDIEIYRLLQTGFVRENPTRTPRKEWKCKVVKKLKGIREAGVVTILLLDGNLFVKTVEWEDWR